MSKIKHKIVNFIIQKLKSKHTSLRKYTNWAKLVHFSLVSRERKEKNKYFAPEAHDNPYKCSDCDYKNIEQDNVFEHMKEKHQGKNPYRCGKCDFTASNGDSVLKHIDENHKENNGAFSRFFPLNSMIFDI